MTHHLALPVRIVNGQLATVARGSLADVTQSVAMLLDTRPGERLSIPTYGLNDPTFEGLDEQAIAAAVTAHEPRAEVEVTSRTVDGVQTAGVVVTLKEASR